MSAISDPLPPLGLRARLVRVWRQIPLTWAQLEGLRGDFWLAMGLTGLAAGTGLLLPTRAQKLVTEVIPSGELRPVAWEVLLILVITIFSIGFSGLRRFVLQRMSVRLIARIRGDLFRRMLAAGPRQLQKTEGGTILSGFTNDIMRYQDVMEMIFAVLIPSAVFIVAYVGGMIWFSWTLSLSLVLVALPLILATGYFADSIHTATHRVHHNLAEVNRDVGDALGGIREIKLFTLEGRVQSQFDALNEEVKVSFIDREKLTHLHPFVVTTFVAIGLGAIILIAAAMLSYGWITLGALTGFLVCVALAYDPIREFSHSLGGVMQLSAVRERLDDLMALPPEEDRVSGTGARPRDGSISLRDVTFGYEADSTALDGVSLDIADGEQVAIVGPSGAGKSTLLELLPRFHRPRAGQVLIGGVDAAEIPLPDLRGCMGLVLQVPFLFRATLIENLRAGAPEASLAEIKRVARAARVDEFAERLPEGYDTLIEPGGGNLSVGQRQRIAIARVLLKDPPILLLDEPTSALDAASEAHVAAAVQEAARNRTTLIVAHRLSTVRDVDRVIAMDHGRIVEQGSHAELVSGGGLYAGMWQQARMTRTAEADEPA